MPRKYTKKSKTEKKVKVLLPSATNPEEMTEHEISYMDRLLAIDMEKLASKGFTNDQIIKALPISRDTFYKRLKEDPYFSYVLYKIPSQRVIPYIECLFQCQAEKHP